MKAFVLKCLLLVSIPLSAQRYTYVGPNISMFNPWMQRFYEPINTSYLDFGGGAGISLRRTYNDLFSLETGYYNISIPDILGDKSTMIAARFNSENWLFPLRFVVSKYIYEERISVFGYLGPEYWHNSGSSNSVTRIFNGENMLEVTDLSNTENYFLIAGGSGIRIKLIEEMTFTLSLGFGEGLKKLRSYEVNYWHGETLEESSIQSSRGNYWGLTFRLSYPINKAVQDFRRTVKEIKNSGLSTADCPSTPLGNLLLQY